MVERGKHRMLCSALALVDETHSSVDFFCLVQVDAQETRFEVCSWTVLNPLESQIILRCRSKGDWV